MPASDHIRRLREKIGHELLLVPSVCVLPRDEQGRVLLVRLADTGRWGTIGGAIEVDEDPRDAAVREAKEEAGVVVELGPILGVLGGPDYRITYSNGDLAAYVSIVYDATVRSGVPTPDGDETIDVGWFTPAEMAAADIGHFVRAMLRDLYLT
ncbi:MAG TPA: NUDIX domain-containing protein [Actinomycetes bacterium]|nr:NUDIX domain-containing protein [Actinomycetes bacterium]